MTSSHSEDITDWKFAKESIIWGWSQGGYLRILAILIILGALAITALPLLLWVILQ